ncbi:hypothetical protein AVEN_12595-1 [Araneus ventricosus]|uniref:Uncharacterized protein n=1 Tax=Araneus ventricosus TaxID=182803 RepID=A0A4Y2AC73_ARAVE|nr:hypothetical protein AVEN_12595-1 [Araneus ventricosus]
MALKPDYQIFGKINKRSPTSEWISRDFTPAIRSRIKTPTGNNRKCENDLYVKTESFLSNCSFSSFSMTPFMLGCILCRRVDIRKKVKLKTQCVAPLD